MTYYDDPPTYPSRFGPAAKRDDHWARVMLNGLQAICFHPGPHRGGAAGDCPECLATYLARRAHR